MSRVDVTQQNDVQNWIDSIPWQSSGATISRNLAVINHGILGPKAALRDVSVDQFAQTIAINSTGAFGVLHALMNLPVLPDVIAVLTSSVGRVGRAGWGPYSASKFVVESLVQTAAEEFDAQSEESGRSAPIIFAFNPGGTATDMRAAAYPQEDPSTIPSADVVGAKLIDIMLSAESGLNGESIDYRDL